MAQQSRSPQHREHGRPRYQKGCQCPQCVADGMSDPCRCAPCTTANREYSRRNKRLKSMNGGQAVAEAPHPGGIRVERDPGRLVETLVGQELDALPAAEKMPGLGAAALAMARVLDDPSSVPQHPGAAGQLVRIVMIIRNQGVRREGGKEPRQGGGGLAERRGALRSVSPPA